MKEDLKNDYQNLWDRIIVSDKTKEKLKPILDKILKNKERYIFVSKITNVPWQMIAAIHSLECSLNFNNHLHNGDPLTGKTFHVPAGRPLVGNPPYSWEASAIDALVMKISGGWPKEEFEKAKNMEISSILYLMELYNGMGYRKYHPEVKTPYLWSGTNNYVKGKYVEDGKFNSEAVSGQVGAAAILRSLLNMNEQTLIVKNNEPISLNKLSEEKIKILQKLINDIASDNWGNNFEPLIVDGKAGNKTKELFNKVFGVNIA